LVDERVSGTGFNSILRRPPLVLLQQNEIIRENTFVQYEPNKTNAWGLIVMTVIFPVLVHWVVKAEMEHRDIVVSHRESPRERL
jgi:hypothetical protein